MDQQIQFFGVFLVKVIQIRVRQQPDVEHAGTRCGEIKTPDSFFVGTEIDFLAVQI